MKIKTNSHQKTVLAMSLHRMILALQMVQNSGFHFQKQDASVCNLSHCFEPCVKPMPHNVVAIFFCEFVLI